MHSSVSTNTTVALILCLAFPATQGLSRKAQLSRYSNKYASKRPGTPLKAALVRGGRVPPNRFCFTLVALSNPLF